MAPHSNHDQQDLSAEKSMDEIPVLIVGGGPTGLLMAHMLSELGVKSLIIERYPTRLAAPKAHALSPRTLEVCRQFNLDVNEIRNLGTKRADAYWVNFMTSLAGHHAASIPYERMDPEVLADTPLMIHNISQPTFENLVAERLRMDGVIEVRKNHSFVGCEQAKRSDQVITSVEDRASGTVYQIRSKQLIACDGANSKVREHLGVNCEGESSCESSQCIAIIMADPADETMMTIHFNADIRPVVGENLGMLHWVMDPEVAGFIISYDLDDNQVLICNFDPKKHPLKSWDEALCRKTVTAALGTSNVSFDVLSYRPWVLSRKVAERYRIGNVFLAGDAAHSFPPTGGLGLNSGLGDVSNLAYKIAAVNRGWGGSALLDTYESERRPVALVNAQQSVKNGQQIFSLLRTLGMTDSDPAVAKANLYRRITDPATKAEVLKGVEAQREHFDNNGLHIGYVYGDKETPPSASLYKPSYRAGARLPHAWLAGPPDSSTNLPPIDSSYVTEFTPDEVAAKQYSTLDLCHFASFTLLADELFSDSWSQVVETINAKLLGKAIKLKINLMLRGVQFKLVPGSRADEWVKGFRLRSGHAALVRPDQHILNVFSKGTGVEQILDGLLGHLGLLI